MVTPILLTGFEHGVIDNHQGGASGTGICDSFSGTLAVDTAAPITGLRSLKLTMDRVTACNVTKDLPSAPTVLVGKLRFKTTAAHPEQTTTLFWFTSAAATTVKIRLNTDGTIGCQVGSGSTSSGGVDVCDGAVHTLGFRLDISAGTWTLDWEVDGIAKTQGSAAIAASTLSNIRYGSANSGDGSTAGFSIWYDDVMLSATGADYPIPNFLVYGYSPNADGTHNAGLNVIERDTGTDIGGGVTAWDFLDDVPLPTGTPTSDWIQQVQIDAARYAEVQFTDQVWVGTPPPVLGVNTVVAYFSSATAANNGTTRIVLADGTTLTDIYAGDMSESVVHFKQTMLAVPSGGWDSTKVNGLKARVGFASDVTPTPRWCALMQQVAWLEIIPASAALTGTGALSAKAQANFGGTAHITGAGSLVATAAAELTGSAALTGFGTISFPHTLFQPHLLFNAHIPFGDGGRPPIDVPGDADIAGAGELSATAAVSATGRADLDGLGSASASARLERLGAAVLAALGDLSAVPGPRTTFSGAVLAGAGVLEASSDVTAVVVAFTGHGVLVATAAAGESSGAALLAGALGSLIATADVFDRPSGDMPFVDRAEAWEHVPVSPARQPQPPTREVAWASLDAAGRIEYLRTLLYSHPTMIRVDVLDASENPVGSLTAPSSVLYDGSLQVDTTADVPTRLTLSVADPDHELLDTQAGSAITGSISPASFLQVTRLDFVPLFGQWVSVPIFTGPVTSYNREGPDASLEAMGKEYLYQGPEQNWRSVSIRRGARVVDAIRAIAEARGETRFRLPEVGQRLNNPVTVPQGSAAWPVLLRLANTLGRVIYFDALGQLTIRVAPVTPAWVFAEPGAVDTEPQVTFDVTAIRNTVHVVGKAPARGPRPGFIATAPPEHPLSPVSLARSGVPRHIHERVETELTRNADCERVAKNRLAAFLIAGTQVSVEALALPPVEPGDVATLTTPDVSLDFRLTSYSMPLLGTGSMQIGEVRHIPTRARRRSPVRGRRL